MSESRDRVCVFIDGSNLYHSLDENCGRADLDFRAFVEKLANGRPIYRTYYYNILQDPDRKPQAYQEQQKFLASLYAVPRLEVRLGTHKYRGDQLVEKGVDIMLATDLQQYAWKDFYDVAIVVSGDGDFNYAVQTVKNLGKYVEVAAFANNLSSDLAHISDERQEFDRDFFADLWVTARKQAMAPLGGDRRPQGPVGQGPPQGGAPNRRRRFRGRRPGGPPPQQPPAQQGGFEPPQPPSNEPF